LLQVRLGTVGRGVVYSDDAASIYSGCQQTVHALLGVVKAVEGGEGYGVVGHYDILMFGFI